MNAIDPEIRTVMSSMGQRARAAASELAFASTPLGSLPMAILPAPGSM